MIKAHIPSDGERLLVAGAGNRLGTVVGSLQRSVASGVRRRPGRPCVQADFNVHLIRYAYENGLI